MSELVTPHRFAVTAGLTAVLVGGVLVLRPFLTPLLWALILYYVTFPLYGRLCHTLGPRRRWGAVLLVSIIGIIMVLPFVVVGVTLADNLAGVTAWVNDPARKWQTPPVWLSNVPLLGDDLVFYWQEWVGDSGKLWDLVKTQIIASRTWLLRQGVNIAIGVGQLSFSLLLLFFLYWEGDSLRNLMLIGFRRLAGERADEALHLAGNTVQAVVYGMLGTAMFQAIVMAIGLAVAGVPSAILWGLLTFFLSPVPVGPPLVWVSAAVWLYTNGQQWWAAFMVIWGAIAVSSLDNVLRPILISRGAQMHFMLVFMGVVGGVLAFGLIGVFIGPAVLAICYTLVMAWLKSAP